MKHGGDDEDGEAEIMGREIVAAAIEKYRDNNISLCN